MTTTSPSSARPSSAAAIERALEETEAQETRLRARRATVAASLDAAERAAATALLDDAVLSSAAVGKGRPAAATSAFAAAEATAAAGPALREELGDIDRALVELDQRRADLGARLPHATLRDTCVEWEAIDKEIAEREAKIRAMFAPIVEYEGLAFAYPHLTSGTVVLLQSRREMVRKSALMNAATLRVDLAALRAEVAR